jgi:hypothetical protein
MLVVDGEGVRVVVLAPEVGMVERQVGVCVLENIGIAWRPEARWTCCGLVPLL